MKQGFWYFCQGNTFGGGDTRWTITNSTLVTSSVKSTDAGLYTCLASNTEGDGHSNAVLLTVSCKIVVNSSTAFMDKFSWIKHVVVPQTTQ